MTDLLAQKKAIHESSWEPAYQFFSRVVEKYNFKKGAEIGVAFGGHSEAILSQTRVEKLYGARPTITWFDSPVVVDNLTGGTITKAA